MSNVIIGDLKKKCFPKNGIYLWERNSVFIIEKKLIKIIYDKHSKRKGLSSTFSVAYIFHSFWVQRDWRVSMSINIENNLINRRRKQETFLSKNYQNSYTQQRNKASSIQIFPPLDQRQEIKLFKKREKRKISSKRWYARQIAIEFDRRYNFHFRRSNKSVYNDFNLAVGKRR